MCVLWAGLWWLFCQGWEVAMGWLWGLIRTRGEQQRRCKLCDPCERLIWAPKPFLIIISSVVGEQQWTCLDLDKQATKAYFCPHGLTDFFTSTSLQSNGANINSNIIDHVYVYRFPLQDHRFLCLSAFNKQRLCQNKLSWHTGKI